jgi:hypothetical protein
MILTGAAIYVAGVSEIYPCNLHYRGGGEIPLQSRLQGLQRRLQGLQRRLQGCQKYTPAMILTGAAIYIAGVSSFLSGPKNIRDV